MKFYGGLAIGGILALTQLLAIFGIAVPLNVTVWMLGGFGSMFLTVVVGVLQFLASEAIYGKKDDALIKASVPTMLGGLKKEEMF